MDRSRPHVQRGPQTSTSSVEEYLESIYKLSVSDPPVKAARLAEDLSVTPASVAEMMKKLLGRGLITRSAGHAIELTEDGRAEALRLLRRHRLSERFLTDIVGLSWDKVHDEACRFEHVLSDEVAEGLDRVLNNPEVCPHGYPIPDKDGVIREEPLPSLLESEPGTEVVIRRVPEEDPELLRYLAAIGVIPGAAAVVGALAPFDGPLSLSLDGAEQHIGRELASKIGISMSGAGTVS